MSKIWNDIVNMVNERFTIRNEYIGRFDHEGKELGEAIDWLFAEAGVEYSIEQELCFESPGYDTGMVFAAWIEDGKLQTISFQWEAM